MTSLLHTLLKHKVVLVVVGIGLVGGGVLWAKTRTPQLPLRYVLAAATKGTVVTSISGSGQVSGQNQIDLKPTVSATINKILVTPGQSVSSSQALFELDPKEAQKTVRDAARNVSDAQISVASAELLLRKLQQPPDAVALLQSENSVNQAQRALDQLREPVDPLDVRQAEADVQAQQDNVRLSTDGTTPKIIRDAYDNAVPTLKTISQTVTQTLYSADDVLGIDRPTTNDAYERFLSAQDSVKLQQTNALYVQARPLVRALKTATDALASQNESTATIDEVMRTAQSTLEVMGSLTQGVYDVLQNTISSIALSESALNGLKSTAQSDRSNITNKLTSLTSLKQSIEQARDNYHAGVRNLDKAKLALDKLQKGPEPRDIASAEERLQEARASLAKLKRGADALDILSSQNTVNQRRASVVDAQNKLHDAQEALTNYTIRAPFEGVIAKVSVKEKDQASPSTALATLLTHAKIAQITLNEVDVSKVQTGQKATLTFDALPDLTIAGSVSEVDSIGTVSQGVVSYSVKILFVTQDDRVKPGMSVSASIITATRVDVLTVPNAAVSNGSVQVLSGVDPASTGGTQGIPSATAPEIRPVQTGLVDDKTTEILSGLREGELVVTRTIDPAQQAAASAARTGAAAQTGAGGIRIPGLTGGVGGGGGNFTRPAGR
jgi:multidrug efflux pump subunit AcrA (membrane-fusion protein)